MADLITITVDSSDVVKATQYTNELTAANDRLEKELKPLLAKEKEFQRAIRQVNEAMRLNVITNKKAIAQVQALGKQYGYTQQQIDRATASMTGIRKNTNRMNATIQNAGYQIGDFAVQVQSGQNVMVAFSQQGAQLAGLLPGVAGAVTGVALVIGSSLVRALMEGSDLFKSFGESVKDAVTSIEKFEKSSSSLANAIEKKLPKAAITAFEIFEEERLEDAIKKVEAQLTKSLDKTEKGVEGLNKDLQSTVDMLEYELGSGRLDGEDILAGLQEIKILEDTIKGIEEVEELFREISSVDLDNPEQLASIMETIAYRARFLKDQNKINAEVFNELNSLVEILGERLAQLPGTASEVTDELAAQKAHLEAILRLEQARDNLAGSIEQKFAASTRKLELMRGGMGAGLAGSQVSMEQQIAELVAAERAVIEATQKQRGSFSLQDNLYLADFERGLRAELDAHMQRLAAIKELSAVKTKTSKVELEQLDAQVQAYLKVQETIHKVLDAKELELRQSKSLIGLSKEEAELQKFIYDLEKKMGVTRAQLNEEQTAQFETILELRREELVLMEQKRLEDEKQKAAMAKVQAVSSAMASETVGALKSIVNGTKTASEAFRDMALNIIQQIMDILIWQPLIDSLTRSISGALTPASAGGSATGMFGNIVSSIFGFQKGGAFSAGNVIPFANGGIVGSPTMFGMSGGRTGLMGEAGPEAIMPLKRGPNGKLGVEGGGNVTVNQTFNFAANGDDSVKKIIAEAAPKIAKMTEAQIINSRQRGGQMRRAFG